MSRIQIYCQKVSLKIIDRLCGLVVTDPDVPDSISGPTRFPEKLWLWSGGPFSLMRITEELLEWNIAASV
jgi:hypothetical protein